MDKRQQRQHQEEPSKPPPIAWTRSPQRELLLNDLLKGILPISANDCSARNAWQLHYSSHPLFKDLVPFEQFRDRLRDHRRQLASKSAVSRQEEVALQHDRQLFPRQAVNFRGEIEFCQHPARDLLRQAVKNNYHNIISFDQLKEACDPENDFTSAAFRKRLREAIKYQKFVNHLEEERLKKGTKL